MFLVEAFPHIAGFPSQFSQYVVTLTQTHSNQKLLINQLYNTNYYTAISDLL